MGRPSKWSPEFREEAVRMYRESGESIAGVARRLGLGPETFRRWVREDEVERVWGAKTRWAPEKSAICRQDAIFGTPTGVLAHVAGARHGYSRANIAATVPRDS
jgi:Transposase